MELKEILKNIYTNIHENKDYLIELDQKFGDGDLGLSMDNGFKAIYKYSIDNQVEDKGVLFKNLSSVFNEAAPSSLGTIISIFLMGMAKKLKSKLNPSKEDYISALKAGLDYLKTKIDTKLGDKTILDSLEPAINVLVETEDKYEAYKIAKIKMEETKNMISNQGRAKYHGEKTLGYIDGGAYVAYLIFKGLTE